MAKIETTSAINQIHGKTEVACEGTITPINERW